MEWVETTGRSVEEAKDAALDQLGVDSSDAEFEIVSDAKTGLFGRLKTEARVRARVKPAVPRSKDAANARKRKPPRKSDRGRNGSGSGGAASSSGLPSSATRSSLPESLSTADTSPERDDDSDRDHADQKPSSRTRKPRSRSRKPANNPQGNAQEGVPLMEDTVALDEQGRVASDFLNGLLEEIGSQASIDVTTDEEDELVKIAIDADNLGRLIGPRGATLHALQELTRTVVQRKTGARNGRILVDIAKYREKRRVALERFAQQVAEEVKSSGEPKMLEPMNPADRKVVHDVINGIDGVSTSSEGEEPRRRVVIKPSA